MSRALKTGLLGGTIAIVASLVALAQTEAPKPGNTYVFLDQGVDQETLQRYHHTDQGTRLLPAAWIAALEKPDGSGKVMDPAELAKYGFILDPRPKSADNPYDWPIGFTVSDPKATDGVAIGGITCAACHTGRIDYKGQSILIEGGQSMIDLIPFFGEVVEALKAVGTDHASRNKFILGAIKAGYPAHRIVGDLKDAVSDLSRLQEHQPGTKVTSLPAGPGRADAVQGIANRVFGTDLQIPTNQRGATAPVSYPYLWDIWRLSWLQYNAFLPPLAQSRNIGEVLGSEARTNFVNDDGDLNPEPDRWRTSIQMPNLIWMESMLEGLKAPTWPEDVLGPIDPAKAATGRDLFAENCAGCHGIHTLPDGMWDVTVIPLEKIGTDPNQATNWAVHTYDLTKIGLQAETPAYLGVNAAVNPIRRQLYADFKIPESEQQPDLSAQAPCGYKARPLIGVWATPPFLHNGSVRTVFELLSDTRPTSFTYGTREYDPVNLGYTEDPSGHDAVLDTTIAGNHNTGHWWTDDTARPGRIGRKLSDEEKYAIIEYLKSANYDNYPTKPRDTAATMPCQDEQDWAIKAAAAAQ